MAIKRIPVPFCDVCKEPWLPKHRLADGTVNPVFTDPSLGKRCGKCKRTGWNAGGVDRRRKNVITVLADPEDGPVVGTVEAQLDVDLAIENPRSQAMIENLPMPVIPPELFAYAEHLVQDAQLVTGGAISSRCRHGLYKCPQCHSEKAA